jgi:hypothetical protein
MFDCKKVIIHRNINEVIDSCARLFGKSDSIVSKLEYFNEKLNLVDGLHVKFEDINERLRDIWDYCVDLPYDKERERALLNMNIQVDKFDMFDNLALLDKLELKSCH